MVRKFFGIDPVEQGQAVAEQVKTDVNEFFIAMMANQDRQIETLKRQNEAIMSVLKTVSSEITSVKSKLAESHEIISEDKVTHFIGKKPKLLQSVSDEVAGLSYKEIRQLILRACRYQKDNFDKFYAKLAQVSGKDVYAIGKTRLMPEENDFGAKDNNTTYINTVFKEGVHREAAAIALDMMRNK